MRLYHKTTTHPYCIYLTRDEARELQVEALIAVEESGDVPLLADLAQRLDTVQHVRQGSQA